MGRREAGWGRGWAVAVTTKRLLLLLVEATAGDAVAPDAGAIATADPGSVFRGAEYFNLQLLEEQLRAE